MLKNFQSQHVNGLKIKTKHTWVNTDYYFVGIELKFI